MQRIKTFFQGRSILGFYLPALAMILALVSSLLYQITYFGTSYYNIIAFLFPLLSGVSFLVLIAFSKTERFASLAMGVLIFVGLLLFIRYVYMYLSTVFYDGISFDAISHMDSRFILIFLFELSAVIISNIGIYNLPKTEKNTITKETSHE